MTAGKRTASGRSASPARTTHVALRPVTAPRCTRHSSPSSTWSGGIGAGRARERGPAAGLAQAVGAHLATALQVAETGDVGHPAQAHRRRRPRRPGDREARDRGGHRRVLEGRGGRLDHVDRLAAERAEQQLAHQAPVVGVEPLGGRDERPGVARLRAARRGQEEVDVQARQPARLEPVRARRQRQPLLPDRRRSGGGARTAGCRGRGWRRRRARGRRCGSRRPPRGRGRPARRRRGGRGRRGRPAGRAPPRRCRRGRTGAPRRPRTGPSRRPGRPPVPGRAAVPPTRPSRRRSAAGVYVAPSGRRRSGPRRRQNAVAERVPALLDGRPQRRDAAGRRLRRAREGGLGGGPPGHVPRAEREGGAGERRLGGDPVAGRAGHPTERRNHRGRPRAGLGGAYSRR